MGGRVLIPITKIRGPPSGTPVYAENMAASRSFWPLPFARQKDRGHWVSVL